MRHAGGSGRGALWYGDPSCVLRGRFTYEGETLPAHEDERPFARDPLRKKKSGRKRRRKHALHDPLTGRKSRKRREDEWSIANGIWPE